MNGGRFASVNFFVHSWTVVWSLSLTLIAVAKRAEIRAWDRSELFVRLSGFGLTCICM